MISRRNVMALAGIGGIAMATKLSAETTTRRHAVLLGDSIFDNKVYVGSGPAVIDQVAELAGDKWKATLLAVDGDVTNDVAGQLDQLPDSATHLIISVGGNDALQNQHVLAGKDESAAVTFLKLANIQIAFGKRYNAMLKTVLDRKKPTAVCTIYDPNFPNADQNKVSSAALSAFNDRITRAAFAHGLPVIDLRQLFQGPADYANPIEPGVKGGAKIAEQIKLIVETHDFGRKQSVIYPQAI